jgi:hypothetical protein
MASVTADLIGFAAWTNTAAMMDNNVKPSLLLFNMIEGRNAINCCGRSQYSLIMDRRS